MELELSAAEMVGLPMFIDRAELGALRQLDERQHHTLSADGDVSRTILRFDEHRPNSRRSIPSLSTRMVCRE